MAARYGAIQRKADGPDASEPAPGHTADAEPLCADEPALESAAEGAAGSPGAVESPGATEESAVSWTPSGDAGSDAEDLLAGRGVAGTASSSAEDWCEKIANRLMLSFDSLIRGVKAAERELKEPDDRAPPDDWVLNLALTLALTGVTGPASAIIGRFITRAIASTVLAETINLGVRTAMSHAVERSVAAITSPGKDRDPDQKAAKNQTLNRFLLRQELALQSAKGDAFDFFIDAVRPALRSAPEDYLRSLHEHLAHLNASEELAYAQAARTIAAWTSYLAYWTYGSFGSQVDFYRGLGRGLWARRYSQGVIRIRLKPMVVPEPILVGPRHGVLDGTAVEVESMRIGGISDSAKAVLRDNMQFVGDLRGIPMFVTFQAHMMPTQKSIPRGIGPNYRELREFTIELARQPDGSVMLGQYHAQHEDQWLTGYHDSIFGGGSAEQGARDIFDQLDRVPLPDFR